MKTCTVCSRSTVERVRSGDYSLFIQQPDGDFWVIDLPDGLLLGQCGACQTFDFETLDELRSHEALEKLRSRLDAAALNDIDWPKWPSVTVRVRVTAKPPVVVVGGGGVTVKPPSVTVKPPSVVVGGVKLPEVTVGSPRVGGEPLPPADYKVFKECRFVSDDADVHIVNQENFDVLVTVNVGGMLLDPAIVKKNSSRRFGKFSNKTCAEVEDYVALWTVSKE